MHEIVVLSGKGGTGKTSITAAFAALAASRTVLADCDVDAANLHLLAQPDFAAGHVFYSGVAARIDALKCTGCGKCREICRFDAIHLLNGHHTADPRDCEGCGYCARSCPEEAIQMLDRKVGEWYVSDTRFGCRMVHAHLGAGGENSGKLVAQVKKEANRIARDHQKDFVLVDGPPGIGCPVISALSGADFVLLVTEPTVSGLHDLSRIVHLIQKFRLRAGCIINKHDLNPENTAEIQLLLAAHNLLHLADLPYDDNFTRAMMEGKTIVEYEQNSISCTLKSVWEKIMQIINQEGKST